MDFVAEVGHFVMGTGAVVRCLGGKVDLQEWRAPTISAHWYSR